MSKINWNKYKFRPSQLDLLMTKSRSKTDTLSATAKAILDDIFIKEVYGREKIIISKYMEKGINEESESISLYRKYKQIFTTKNEEKFENKYLTGTPDLILRDKIVDVKTNWDIWTFMQVDEAKAKKDYYYQLVAYMWLANKTKADLAYCLIDNTEADIYAELQKIKYIKGLYDDSEELLKYEEQLYKNNKYEDIPNEQKIKIFTFELKEEDKTNIKNAYKNWINYLDNKQL